MLALLEAQHHFDDDRYGDAALRSARAIAAGVDQEEHWSLYSGLTGMAVALHAVHDRLGDAPSGAAARAALDRVRAHFDGQRWSAIFELLGGNAGIALGALSAGDLDLALLAVMPYLHTADPTPGGVNWAVRPSPPRSHHIAHGTLGGLLAPATSAVEGAAQCGEVHEVATDAAGAATSGATDAALSTTSGAEQGQDSTCGEQLRVLAVELGKAQYVRHPDPPRRGPQRAGNRATHRLHRQFGYPHHGQKKAAWKHAYAPKLRTPLPSCEADLDYVVNGEQLRRFQKPGTYRPTLCRSC